MNEAPEIRIALEAMVHAALRAPSGDNTQPWRFEIDPARGRVSLLLDESRDPSPMNAGQQMALIACGAALENMTRTAARMNLRTRLIDVADDSNSALATLEIDGVPSSNTQDDETLDRRVSNRRVYESRPVEATVLDALREATPVLSNVRVVWLTDKARMQDFSRMEGQAFGTMYQATQYRKAVLENIRFDRPATEEVKEGLSMASLELDTIQRVILKAMDRLPAIVLRGSGLLMAMAAHIRALVRSSSGLCIVLAGDDTRTTELDVGRSVQRAWLELTRQGLAAQPMMVTQVLRNAVRYASPETVAALGGPARVENTLAAWPQVMPETGTMRPAFVLRFGYAAAPSGRCGRRNFDEVVTWARQPALEASHV